jgi:hypothetical protein
MLARSTPERIVIGKRSVGVPLPELDKWETLAGGCRRGLTGCPEKVSGSFEP